MRAATQRRIVDACARVLCVALALFALPLAAARGETSGMLRVRLARLGSPASVTMQADCDYTLAGDPAVRIPSGSEMTLSAKGDNLTLTVGGRSVGLGASARLRRGGTGASGMVFLSPALSNRFCGDLVLSASGGTVSAILRIYIEDYLYGVVGNEMPPSSGIEALKAQAIVARNYALQRKSARNGSGYDLSDSGDALSFRGYSDASEYGDVVKAVDETRGQIACYGDSPATCYFCDSNGGQTESSANAFDAALPYSQVMDDPHDLEGGGVKKTATLRRDAEGLDERLQAALDAGVADALREQGLSPEGARIDAIEAIQAVDPRYESPSRLYRALAFTLSVTTRDAVTTRLAVRVPTYGALEQWYDLSINDGDNETVWVSRSNQAFEITFRRKGSGVGMSQRGAIAMARRGLSCETILDYYYPGVKLRRETLSDKAQESTANAAQSASSAQPIATARLKQKTRLYESADASSAARTTLPAGASVTVYAVRGEWAAIGSGKLTGFIHTDALTAFALAGATAAQVPGETYARISGSSVKVLQLPVRSALAVDTLDGGTLVRLNAYTDKWALIATASGVEGFIPRSALTLQAGEASDNAGDIVTAQDNLFGLLTERAGLYVNTDDSVEPQQLLDKDARVRILAYNDTWAQVCTSDGATGFVKLASLSAVQQVNAAEGEAPDGGDIVVVRDRPTLYVSADALSLFKSYSTESDILATLNAGEKVRLGAYNDKWACIRVRGITGFVLRSGLSEDPPRADADAIEGGRITTVKGKRYATVTAESAPLYPSWSEADAPITRLERGARVQIGAYNGAWACVNADGAMGYMRIDALELTDAQPAGDSGVNYLECDATLTADAALYRSAELSGTPLAELPRGASVHVYAFNGHCAYVDYEGRRGFVALRYLKKND